MSQKLLCPDVHELEQFNIGDLPDADAEMVEDHLAHCAHCVETLHTLHAQDTLIDARRAQITLIDRPSTTEPVQTLIHRLKELASGPAADTQTAFSQTPRPADSGRNNFEFLAPPQEPDEMGRLGPYRILRVLGMGGMGIVFQAEDTQLHRLVALKILHPALAVDASHRRRFLREAQAAAAITHDHLVPIYQVGEDRGVPFLAMQLLQGETLENRLRRPGKMPAEEVARIGREIATGLAAAHQCGLIHRDIKPGNIWLESGRDRVKILDFGLARAAEDDVRLTDPGVFVGTPLWVAPEQADGRALDCRCDLFTLGSVLYALCTGQPPFQAETSMGVLRRVCDTTPQPVREINPEIPDWLADIVTKLHAKDPADRFQSAAEVAALLERYQPGREEPALDIAGAKGKASPPSTLRTVPRRGGRGWLAAAAVLLLSVAGLGLTEATGITHLTTMVASLVGGARDTTASSDQQADAQPPLEAKGPHIYPTAVFTFDERPGTKDYGAKVSDLLFAKLAAKPALVLVDRNDLKKTLEEQALNLSGVVNPSTATRVGQLTGAKILVCGSVFQADKKIYLVARIVGTETGRILGANVDGKITDELGPLVDKLAEDVADKIARQGNELVAKTVTKKDRLAEMSKSIKGKRPTVMIKIAERHVGPTALDPAAQTELMLYCKAAGFEVVDAQGAVGKADILITGEGISELATRHGSLVSVKARVELKVVERKTDKVLASDRQSALVVDLTEQIAAKSALQEAAATLAERILPKLVNP